MRLYKVGDYVLDKGGHDAYWTGEIIETNHSNKWHEQRVKIRYFHKKSVQGNLVESWSSTDFLELDKRTLREDKLKTLLDENENG